MEVGQLTQQCGWEKIGILFDEALSEIATELMGFRAQGGVAERPQDGAATEAWKILRHIPLGIGIRDPEGDEIVDVPKDLQRPGIRTHPRA